MKITQESDYGFRVVLYLSNLGYGKKIEAKTIAKDQNVPLRFLLKLLRKLTQAGIVKSFRGVNGGYALNRMPEDITLRNIIEAIDGPIYLNRCLYDTEHCNAHKKGHCGVHNALSKVQGTLINELESINFKDIMEDKI
ncbi:MULTISPECIES: RrF2 family transcriptional regulator [Clostridium]|uniref:HTH-type transcriptional regulator CymR n=4 Tax=Clostridium TaxID=1485 RepID=D8GRS7_CLOLD|nr:MULTISPECIES: Rrf2 family transcriptional regulator [Clostridium]ADK16445.1 predicted transcription regulator [Clostridium ljungdahlii DSM 13528]AGY75523.1 Rrf2 family transcriptional regulator [Clostridium autoethanogenum DSM 10061]ALU35689.1 Transcriptional regulator BadM/Rrf2 family [Clostridium autoethanogenum DSM 10061]OAA89679.1 HTH-type transcriptional regulator CymR [Clostridium ljungdahlii DSM 13528]OAA94572.1 HTH-type transcriptional regulator CymR [Clostridium coskatii]